MASTPINFVDVSWNPVNYSTTFQTSLTEMMERKILVDVTLSCENVRIECHRMVLASCSPYFADLLTKQSSPNLVICLVGVQGWQLLAIISFMYTGKVTGISKQQLEALSIVAKALQIRGFGQNYATTQSTGENLSETLDNDGRTSESSDHDDQEEPPLIDLSKERNGKLAVTSVVDFGKIAAQVVQKAFVGSNPGGEHASFDGGVVPESTSTGSSSLTRPRRTRKTRQTIKTADDGSSDILLRSHHDLNKRRGSRESSGDSPQLSKKNKPNLARSSPSSSSPQDNFGVQSSSKELTVAVQNQTFNRSHHQLDSTSPLILAASSHPGPPTTTAPGEQTASEYELRWRLTGATYLTMYGFSISQAAAFYGVSEPALCNFMMQALEQQNQNEQSNQPRPICISERQPEPPEMLMAKLGKAAEMAYYNALKSIADQPFCMLPK